MWERPEPQQKIDLTKFVVDQLIEKIHKEKLLINPSDILYMAFISVANADIVFPCEHVQDPK